MSSRFVSSGAIDATTGASLDVERRTRAAALAATKDPANQNQTLYDILQANKAAKQAAFEEASKIKNQFRALDEDEIEFLDEVRARQR
ncbi:NEFA-interacting nuclear protein NIP30, partial [Coniella lustricola]